MFWVLVFPLGPHAQLPAPWDIWPAILVLLHVFRLYNLQTVTRDEFITASKRGPHSIWKTQPEAIPCKFWLHSAHVAQHPQVILGRALGHQCRHPPRLNHEQLLRQAQARHPPMVGRPDFGRVAGPLPSSVVDDTVPGTNTISCWGSRSSEFPLCSWLLCSVSSDFVCGHHHRIWW